MSRLIRLVYASKALFEPVQGGDELDPTITNILQQSRRNNLKHRIGGVLYYADGYFFQCLEGKEPFVMELIETLRLDERHENLKISYLKHIRWRYFKEWSMKYVPVVNEIQELMVRSGYELFTPNEFDEADINSIMDIFAHQPDPTLQDPELLESAHLPKAWWQKIFRRSDRVAAY